MATAPDGEDDRVDEQLKDAGGDDAADHGGGDALHYVSATLCRWGPHDRQQTEEDGANGHDLRANALNGAFNDGVLQISHRVHSTGRNEFFPGMIKVKEHDDAGLRIETGQSNETDPNSHTQIVAEQVQEPEGADEGEGDRQEYYGSLHCALCIHVDEHESDEQRERNNDFQLLLGAPEVLELAGPLDVVTGRELHGFI